MYPAVYRELVDDAILVRMDLKRRHVLFSISGFTEDLKDIAEGEGVRLVCPEELFGRQ